MSVLLECITGIWRDWFSCRRINSRKRGTNGAHRLMHSVHNWPGRVSEVPPHLAMVAILQERSRPARSGHMRGRSWSCSSIQSTCWRRSLRPRGSYILVGICSFFFSPIRHDSPLLTFKISGFSPFFLSTLPNAWNVDSLRRTGSHHL